MMPAKLLSILMGLGLFWLGGATCDTIVAAEYDEEAVDSSSGGHDDISFSEDNAESTNGLSNETFNASVDMDNIPYVAKPSNDVQVMNLFSSLLHANGKTWYVSRDPADGRPYVWQKTDNSTNNTTATKYPIDTQTPTYYAWNDQHHAWSIGIDSAGYLHVMGDMHNYPYGPKPGSACPADSPAGPAEVALASLPTRYQCQVALYWRSNRPYDASAGFTFRGNSLATAPQAITMTYPRFFHAPNGDLYFTSLAKALRDSSSARTGQMAIILHRYDVVRGSWTAIGGSVRGLVTDTPNPSYTTYYPAFFWDNGGAGGNGSPHPWFQGFQHQFRFDRNGGMHFCAAINLNTNPYGNGNNTRLLYAFSPDGGTTWKKANGTTITNRLAELPLRAAPGQARLADLVIDTNATGAWSLGDFTVVAADSNNMPACRAMRAGANNELGHWYRWNGRSWTDDMSDAEHGGLLHHWNALAPMGPDGRITYLDTNTAIFRRSDNHAYQSKTYDARQYLPELSMFKNVSDKGLWDNGALYGVGFFGNPTTSMKVVRVSFNPNTPYTVTERYPNQVTTNWVWDKGPYHLAAGQQLKVAVTPTSGSKVGVSNEIWSAGYANKLTTVWSPSPTELTYTGGYPKVGVRLYTGVAGVAVNVAITRPSQVAYFAYPSTAGLTLRGPFKVKAGEMIRHIVTASTDNTYHVNNEIWNSSQTTKLAEVNSQTTSTLSYTATADTEVYTGTYIGVPDVKLSTAVHY